MNDIYTQKYKDGVAFMANHEEVAFFSTITNTLRHSAVTNVLLDEVDYHMISSYVGRIRELQEINKVIEKMRNHMKNIEPKNQEGFRQAIDYLAKYKEAIDG